jgi:CO/xanthine dehydrogenase FAD-binding subunit
MTDFGYVCARSLEEALQLLNEPGCRSRVLAGGTDLLVQARSGSVDFDRVVDITRVPELTTIETNEITDGPIVVGAAVTFARLLRHLELCRLAPLLVAACKHIGSPQIRNAATLGGNVANAAACADSVPALVCLEAEVLIASPAGESRCRVADLITGAHQTQLTPGSLIRAFIFNVPPTGSCAAFERLGRRRAMAIARLSLAALGERGEDGRLAWLRLVPGAAFSRFRRAVDVEQMVVGQLPSRELFTAAGRRMADLFLAESGKRWSAEWKQPALAALTERALWQVAGGAHED